ncbi:Phage integrase SAM-like domain-containing protein [Porphyromonadaceae bacterium KH3R12]|uniref:phage integrase SAM-like domain-containing protein n=1 Tax=Proteiniphilum saccharofermentans TaxID=1642647 RepID=UPI000898BB4D|nr:phage integrase SAM-like domain-containing protein [Proteiniphilum saccharofermentans]SDZ72668.1 Phage integrase SAM-like domain-containing protein [Porphyromonadaceae bacterium KH3R12]
MATIRVKLRISTVPGKAGSIYYQVIHRRQHVQLTSSIKLYSHEWDTQNARVRINGEKVSFLLAAQRAINADLAVLHDIISRKEAVGVPYDVADIAFAFRALIPAEEDFFLYMEKRIGRLEEENAHGTALNYRRAYRSFAAFLGKQYLPFPACTEILISEYEQWLRQRKIKRNSSSFYMRVLRAVYNSAVSDGLVPAGNPFRKVYTGIDTTRKRAVGKQIIKQLKKTGSDRNPGFGLCPRSLFSQSLFAGNGVRGYGLFAKIRYPAWSCDLHPEKNRNTAKYQGGTLSTGDHRPLPGKDNPYTVCFAHYYEYQ